jgi:hypothetical protein
MGRIMTTGGDDRDRARELQDRWLLQTLPEYLGDPVAAPIVRDFPDPGTTTWLER